MDRKSILILIISFALLMLWFPLVNKLYPPLPAPHSTNTLAQATNALGSPLETNQPSGIPAGTPATSTAPSLAPLTKPDAPEELMVLENENMRLILTSHGGGIKLVELKNHHETVSCRNREESTNNVVTLNTEAPRPILAVLGGETVQGDGVFTLSRTDNAVRAEKLLTNGLHLIKEFRLSSNYLISASVKWENTSTEPVVLPPQEWVTGTSTPINPHDNGMYMGVFWYDGQKAQHVDGGWFANKFMGCFPGTPRDEYRMGAGNVHWTAAHNQFFTLAVVPATAADQVVIHPANLPPPSRESLAKDAKIVAQPRGYLTSVIYPGTNLTAQASFERQFQIYAGPKEYNTLARLGARMQNDLDLVMDYSGFFGFFAKILLLSMNGLHSMSLPYGLAIIVITIIIKLIFWPLTKASTQSMKRMAALQPQMKALQERYKDDPVKMNRKLMEFMKEHKVSPLGGCLPMLLQIPVFFGFYRMILSATELRGAQFLWACDLSKPDTLFIIPGLNIPFNLLPLIMGATMLWQARLTPASPGMDPMQQKIMKYMPLMFLFILYNFSAGLTLYWTVQNILTIAQMKLTSAKSDASPTTPAPTAAKPSAPPRKKK